MPQIFISQYNNNYMLKWKFSLVNFYPKSVFIQASSLKSLGRKVTAIAGFTRVKLVWSCFHMDSRLFTDAGISYFYLH